ncbi:MAG: DUF3179 domain-containing protein [Planctomycetes bacterium]|nr:DUF3179 domain-containing protein [Planctomycetota bacterium]
MRVWLGVLSVFAVFAAWRLYEDRVFWRAAWSQRSLAPRHEPQPLSLQQIGALGDFNLDAAVIPTEQILPGGPPKDGIPALTDPIMIDAAAAEHLRPDDRVIGYVEGDAARAYPLKILNYHEIVNDRVGDRPVAITYCPLCDSAAVFDRRTPLGEREFGVSGLLYNSNVLMYDREGSPESLWSQLLTQGVTGPAAAKSLQPLPLELTTWADWLSRHPQTRVLSADTGHVRMYDRNPYAGYFSQPQLMSPAAPLSDRLPAKTRVLGVWTENSARAYPLTAFDPSRARLEDEVDRRRLVLEYNPAADSLRVVQADSDVHWIYSFWFAWHAFRPHTDVFER